MPSTIALDCHVRRRANCQRVIATAEPRMTSEERESAVEATNDMPLLGTADSSQVMPRVEKTARTTRRKTCARFLVMLPRKKIRKKREIKRVSCPRRRAG